MFLATNGKLTGIGPAFIGAASNGQPCGGDGACEAGYCADGVCCNEACDGTCEACSTASNAAEDGVCGPAAEDTPDDGCDIEAIETCGQNGTCDGQGSCAHYPDETPCVEGATCSDGVCKVNEGTGTGSDDAMCNDNGELVDNGTIRQCEPYRCRNGQCLEKCSSNRDCSGGFACTAEGQCEPPLGETRVVSCGCRLPLSGRPDTETWLASLLVFCAALRRRRYSRSN
jgi:hypothetical protein